MAGVLQKLLTTAVTLGSVQLSLGDVLWFFIGIALALGIARLVRFILDEDVLPRLPLATGAASAASRLIYYALVVVGSPVCPGRLRGRVVEAHAGGQRARRWYRLRPAEHRE